MHNPTLLGFSLLFLSCASPTLGAPAEAVSAPSSPALAFGFNPPEPASISGTPLLGSTATSSSSDAAVTSASSSFEVATPPSPTEVIAAAAAPTLAAVFHILAATQSAATPTASEHNSAVSYNEDPPAVQSGPLVIQGAAATSGLSTMKHSKLSSSAHKKLANKFKSMALLSSTASVSTPSSTPASSMHLDFATSLSVPASSSVPTPSAVWPQPMSSAFTEPQFSGTRSIVQPTSNVLDDPNPEVHTQNVSDASMRARKTAIVAAFLILGTLSALGGGVLCFKCGVLPCCHRTDKLRRNRKSRLSLATAEEGLQKPPRVASLEKSIVPGAPPIADMPTLSRDSHTPSCSTCPDSVTGMKSGISGSASSWRVYATNEDGQYEDVTHVLASDTYASIRSGHSGTSSYRHSADSSGSRTQPQSSERSHSRASESGASMTAESYKSCESRYSTPSFERRSRDGPPSASASASSSLLPASDSPTPSSPASPISVLLLTPEQGQGGYVGLADAAMPRVVVDAGAPLETVVESEGEDMDIDSQWNVAQALAAPVLQKQKAQVGPGGLGVVEQSVGTVALGGRTCVLMRG